MERGSKVLVKKGSRKKKLVSNETPKKLDKFVISNKQNTTQNLDENITNEQEIHQKELEDNDINKILFKINNVSRKIKWISYIIH